MVEAARGKRASVSCRLSQSGVYGRIEQQQATAWAATRNDAAHAQGGNFTPEQVKNMITGIRDFIAAHPA